MPNTEINNQEETKIIDTETKVEDTDDNKSLDLDNDNKQEKMYTKTELTEKIKAEVGKVKGKTLTDEEYDAFKAYRETLEQKGTNDTKEDETSLKTPENNENNDIDKELSEKQQEIDAKMKLAEEKEKKADLKLLLIDKNVAPKAVDFIYSSLEDISEEALDSFLEENEYLLIRDGKQPFGKEFNKEETKTEAELLIEKAKNKTHYR